MSTFERLGSMDRTWLQIEQDNNLMQLIGVLVLETPLARSALEERLRARLLRFERFHQRVQRDASGAIWDSSPVKLAHHLVEVALAGEDARAALEALIGELAGTPLNPQRPLWQVHLVHGYRGGCVVIARFHQCLADSIALIGLLRGLTDPSPFVSESAAAPPARPTHFEQLYAPLTRAMIETIQLSGAFWARYWNLLFNPQQIFDYARTSTALALEIGKLNGLGDDSHTELKGQPGGVKQVAWSGALDEAMLAGIARTHATSTTAVLLSSLAGALREYLTSEDAALPGAELRILMPVNLRSEDAADKLGNKSGLVPLELPIGIAERTSRLADVHRRVQAFASTYEAEWTLGLFNLLGQSPRAVRQEALRLLAQKSSALLCQVPGSPEVRYLAGARVLEEMFWSPPMGDMGLTISIVHYTQHCQIGLLADAAMLAQPARLIQAIEAELQALAAPPPRSRRKPRKPAV